MEVPFLEVINTMLDETLPLPVRSFWWGNPKKPEDYKYMKSLPYSNCRQDELPPPSMMVLTSWGPVFFFCFCSTTPGDVREPAKYVASYGGGRDKNVLVVQSNIERRPRGASGR